MTWYRFVSVSMTASILALAASCTGDDPAVVNETPQKDAGVLPPVGSTDGGESDTGASNVEAGVDAGPLSVVEGHVIDLYGRPVGNAKVRIGTATNATDGTGVFHFDAVPSSYDLDVVAPSEQTGKGITSFRGLTTRAPTAIVEGVYDLRNAPIAGKINPAVTLATEQHLITYAIDQLTGFDSIVQNSVDQTSDWAGQVSWLGGEKTSLRFLMFKMQLPEGTNGRPYGFLGVNVFSASDLTKDGYKNYQGGLTAIATTTIKGSVSKYVSPATNASVMISVRNSNDAYGHRFEPLTTANSFMIDAPTGIGFVTNVIATAGGNFNGSSATGEGVTVWKASADPAQDVALVFPHAARASSPGEAAVVASGTEFKWGGADPAGVYKLAIRCGGGADEFVSTVYTTAESAILSDGSALGLPWPKAADCAWSITVFSTTKQVDAVVADLPSRLALDHPNGTQDGAFAVYNHYAFKTP